MKYIVLVSLPHFKRRPCFHEFPTQNHQNLVRTLSYCVTYIFFVSGFALGFWVFNAWPWKFHIWHVPPWQLPLGNAVFVGPHACKFAFRLHWTLECRHFSIFSTSSIWSRNRGISNKWSVWLLVMNIQNSNFFFMWVAVSWPVPNFMCDALTFTSWIPGGTMELRIRFNACQGSSPVKTIHYTGSRNWVITTHSIGVGSKPMTINFSGMNIYLPAILKLGRYQGFDP